MYDDGSALYIAHQSSTQSMRQFTRAGNRVSLHATGVGKVLIAAMSEADRARVIAGMDMIPLTSHTLTDPAVLAAECDRIRGTGYAIDDEEQEIGVKCVAMGVPGYPLFAVSVSGPPSRMTDSRIGEIVVPGLTRTVSQIADTLSSTS
jgi:IclR family acetate operon transcriptional repressor